MNKIQKTIRKYQCAVLNGAVRRMPNLGLEQRAEKFTGIFEKYLPEESRVLDIGGAWGFYSDPLERRGHHLTVLDVRRPVVQKSPVVIYDGDKIPFPDKSFDASMLVTVLHHIDKTEDVIKEALRVTRSRIIVIEDLYHHRPGRWWTILRDQLLNFEFVGHPRNFKKREDWIQTFESQGCRRVEDMQLFTWLAGMRILNGVFIFDVKDAL